MKYFFKYEKGYINIDEKYLYMTTTGNWSEITSLNEKSSKTKSQSAVKKIKTYSFYGMMIAFSLLLFFNLSNGKGNKIFLPIGIILMLVSAYKYIRSGAGNQYKIPLSKISKMEYSHKSLKIYFKNIDNNQDFERIETIEEKGIQILKDLKMI
ncbi:MAG: hypothetical protein HC854_09200 [Flavobacterium sp.]|nr:hypothetical protein [Flavobacterium sp.]